MANLTINANSPNFFPANAYKDTETTEDLPLDPPKFSSPFASTVAIRQNFTPPMYGMLLKSHMFLASEKQRCYTFTACCMVFFQVQVICNNYLQSNFPDTVNS